MRLGCFGVLITVGLLWGGGQSLYVGLTNRTVTETSIEDVVKQKPKAKWLRINDGQLDFLGLVYEERIGGEAKDLYIPIRSPDAEDDAPIHVIYHTDDPADLAVAQKMKALNDDPDLNETEFMLKIVGMMAELRPVRTVEGMVEFGIESDKGDGKARKMFENLAPDAIMVEGGEKPELAIGVGMFAAGVLLGLFCLVGMAKKEG